MSEDIVKAALDRLDQHTHLTPYENDLEIVAAEIESLRAALAGFASEGQRWAAAWPDETKFFLSPDPNITPVGATVAITHAQFTLGDLRRASAIAGDLTAETKNG